jgi:hypothetical protein
MRCPRCCYCPEDRYPERRHAYLQCVEVCVLMFNVKAVREKKTGKDCSCYERTASLMYGVSGVAGPWL